jgi:hypothetical protein
MASEMPINFGNMCFGNSKRMSIFSPNTCPVNGNLTQSWSWGLGIGLNYYLSQSNQILNIKFSSNIMKVMIFEFLLIQ